MRERRISSDFIYEHNAQYEATLNRDYQILGEQLVRRHIDIDTITHKVSQFFVAVPSWGTGTGGTRFGRFPLTGLMIVPLSMSFVAQRLRFLYIYHGIKRIQRG